MKKSIRQCKVSQADLMAWLDETLSRNGGRPSYTHRLLRAARCAPQTHGFLRTYFQEALDDARRHLEKGLEDSLSSFKSSPKSPAHGYPENLPRTALLAYLGETLAGMVAEHLDVHGFNDWIVPAFLFRFHDQAFQYLETRRRGALEEETIMGRTGDDALAFRLSEDGRVTDILVCEAKCLTSHRSNIVDDAHDKLSASYLPTSIIQMIQILHEYGPEFRPLMSALHSANQPNSGAKRRNFLLYATGDRPKLKLSRINAQKPVAEYTSSIALEVAEVQFESLADVLQTAFGV